MSASEERARIHNFVGVELDRLAREAPELDAATLYAQAAAAFHAAIEEQPTWYLPHENLADVTSYLGELEGVPHRQMEAMERYDLAIALAAGRAGFLADQTPTQAVMRDIQAELKVSKAISRLMSGLAGAFEAGRDDITSLGGSAAWDPATESSDEVLYAVACYYARASLDQRRTVATESRTMAIRCLREALAINPERIADVVGDPDLRPIAEETADLIRAIDWSTAGMSRTPETPSSVEDDAGSHPAGLGAT